MPKILISQSTLKILESNNVVKWQLWRRHGSMAWWFFEKTPPNSGGVASFKWWRHGSRHRLNGGGGMAVMAEETFCFENFPKITDWVILGWPDPTLNPVFKSKWDEQHTARELPNSSASTSSTHQRRRHHAPARVLSLSHPKSTTAPRTTQASNGRRRQRLQTATATPWFCLFSVGHFFFPVWHSFLNFGSIFFFCLTLFFNFWFCFFFFLFSPLLLITMAEPSSNAATFTLHFALCFYPFVILNSWMSLFGVGYWVNSWNFFSLFECNPLFC